MTRRLDPEAKELVDSLKAHADQIRHSERRTAELLREARAKRIPWDVLEDATGFKRKWLGEIEKGRQRTKRGTAI